MTKREKTLALMIGALLLILVGWSAVSRITAAFDMRHASIDRLTGEIADKELILDRGARAARKIGEFEQASLPGDPALARSLYQGWLLQVAKEKIDMDGVNVGSLPSRPVADVYYQHAFSLNCQGDLQQLSEFLYEFYNAGLLHRISRLHIKPLGTSKVLALSMTVEALSMNNAPNETELSPPRANRLAEADLESYLTSILNRNKFAPANKPPQLASLGTQRGNPNRSIRFQAKASDPENDSLRFEFDGDVLEGAKIDPRSGEVTWTPPANGEYQVSIRVTDNGMPARSATADVTIYVEDPPPPPVPTVEPPGFDPATQAVVTGITDAFGQRKLFITVRTEGVILKLREGDAVDVGTVKGTIKRIAADAVEIETDNGRSIIVELGDSLVDARA